MSSSEFALTAKNLSRTYRLAGHSIPILKDLNLEVKHGDKVFLCGASGAGKTTLLYTLGGLEKPTSGEVFINGEALYSSSANRRAKIRNRDIGFVFQNYHLLPELTALENVLLPSIIKGKAAQQRAIELLTRVGLEERLQHLPTELSGGEQQRVALARALINDPKILLADEPTGNLDSQTGHQIIDLLFGVVGEEKKTLLVVTHDQKLAELGDHKYFISQGSIQTEAT